MDKQLVLNYLRTYSFSYIRPMYRSLQVRSKGMSLNKFRKFLKGMEKEGLIEEVKILPYHDFPCWRLK